MTANQLRMLKWIAAIAMMGGGSAVLLFRQHPIPESLLIAVVFAVPAWTLFHIAEKGLIRRSVRSSYKTMLSLALFCLVLQPPLIMMNMLSHDYVLAGVCVVALGCFVYLAISNARKIKESDAAGEVDSPSS